MLLYDVLEKSSFFVPLSTLVDATRFEPTNLRFCAGVFTRLNGESVLELTSIHRFLYKVKRTNIRLSLINSAIRTYFLSAFPFCIYTTKR